MSVLKHLLLGGLYPRGFINIRQRYHPSDSNKTVDSKFGDHDALIKYAHSRKVGK